MPPVFRVLFSKCGWLFGWMKSVFLIFCRKRTFHFRKALSIKAFLSLCFHYCSAKISKQKSIIFIPCRCLNEVQLVRIYVLRNRKKDIIRNNNHTTIKSLDSIINLYAVFGHTKSQTRSESNKFGIKHRILTGCWLTRSTQAKCCCRKRIRRISWQESRWRTLGKRRCIWKRRPMSRS